MTYFIRNGNTFRITDESAVDISKVLPAGNYVVKYNKDNDFYFLETAEEFKSLPKYYGDIIKNADRIMNTFQDRPSATGVMLVGEKGSGKTLLSKELSIKGHALGVPTILVNEDHHGDTFNKFISSIEQSCLVIWDEFEKIYDEKKQAAVLTLFDGVFPSKKLFVISVNDPWKVNEHMRNRPGRFYYHLSFKGLEEQFIREYAQDRGLSTEHEQQLVGFAGLFGNFNFDMLKAVVEECIRYDESPTEAVKMLNAKPESDFGVEYEIAIKVNGKIVKPSYNKTIKNPLKQDKISVDIYIPNPEDDDDEKHHNYTFYPADFKKFDEKTGSFLFTNNDKIDLILTRQMNVGYNWSKAF